MEMTLLEKTGQTLIKCSKKALPKYQAIIDGFCVVYGGRKERETSRFIYYIIDFDLLTRK